MLAADVSYRHMTDLIRPGGRVASIGVHGNPAALHLEKLWPRDVTITTGLVDTFTAPTLVRLLSGGRIDASIFVAQAVRAGAHAGRIRHVRSRVRAVGTGTPQHIRI